jgi:hypothetical protein
MANAVLHRYAGGFSNRQGMRAELKRLHLENGSTTRRKRLAVRFCTNSAVTPQTALARSMSWFCPHAIHRTQRVARIRRSIGLSANGL